MRALRGPGPRRGHGANGIMVFFCCSDTWQGPLIDAAAIAKCQALIADAVGQGARVT